MKCELCNGNEAETAITTVRDGVEEELYVCRECANKERVRRQKKSLRTRKESPPKAQGLSVSVTRIEGPGGKPPPFIEAIMNAVEGVVNGIGEAASRAAKNKSADADGSGDSGADGESGAEPLETFPCGKIERRYRVGSELHLEGLFLLGEMEAVHRAFRAVGMELAGHAAQGLSDAGHVFKVMHPHGMRDRAERMVADLVAQERNARVRLIDESPRLFSDAICRSLAILKNCRMLSLAELFDLLSPLRLAAQEKYLDGITLKEIEKLQSQIDIDDLESEMEMNMDQETRDNIDSGFADEMNEKFENVVLSEKAEGRFL